LVAERWDASRVPGRPHRAAQGTPERPGLCTTPSAAFRTDGTSGRGRHGLCLRSGAMEARRPLLALADRAPGPLRTLEGAVTTWRRRDRVRTGRGEGSASAGGEASTPAEGSATSYVVVALPRRWRVVERGHVAVTDGERSWVGTGTLVTEHGAERVTLDDAGIIGACLFPGRLLGSLRFGEPEAGEIAGRSCWVVESGPRRFAGDDGRATTLPPEQFGGVEHRFWFDAATGIVLRHEGAVDGRLWATVELTDLRFDRPIPPDEFAPPPGAI